MEGKEIIAKRIIKGLECCDIEYPPCTHCPYQISGLNLCKKHLIGDACYLVKTQQSEIERLNKVIKTNEEIIAELEEQNEIEIADGGASCHWYIEKTKTEAIKEFARKLREKVYPFPVTKDIEYVVSVINAINNIEKEMVGADNENYI